MGGRWADRRWLDRTRALITDQLTRRDARRHATHLAELIACHCDGRTLRSRPTLAVLVAETGYSLRTVQRWTRWLEAQGALTVLEHGVTPRYAPARLRPDDPSVAREWLLTNPDIVLPSRTGTPSQPLRGSLPRAREKTPGTSTDTTVKDKQDRRSAPDSSPAPSRWPGPAQTWPLGQNPRRRGERLAAARALRESHMVLRRLSARHLRSILRPWFGTPQDEARWTPADILHALDTTHDNDQHLYSGRVRDPAAWLRHRLSFWTDPATGLPLPPHSAALAARAAQHRARQARYRAQQDAAASRRATRYETRAAQARAALYAKLGTRAPAGTSPAAITTTAGTRALTRAATATASTQLRALTAASPARPDAPPRWYSCPPQGRDGE